jgi:nitroreductase
MSDVDLTHTDRLLTTTKQVRQRMDLSRPVPRELLLECIDIANHAPIGGNIERNRWLIVDDPDLKAQIAEYYQRVGRPYLEAMGAMAEGDPRQQRVIDSAAFLVDHIADVPAMMIPLRLDRPDIATVAGSAAYWGSVIPGVWSFQLALRSRGVGSAWTTFHLEHESAVAELLGIPDTVTQVALLAVGYYTGDTFHPAPRRPAREITYVNAWKRTVDDS